MATLLISLNKIHQQLLSEFRNANHAAVSECYKWSDVTMSTSPSRHSPLGHCFHILQKGGYYLDQFHTELLQSASKMLF